MITVHLSGHLAPRVLRYTLIHPQGLGYIKGLKASLPLTISGCPPRPIGKDSFQHLDFATSPRLYSLTLAPFSFRPEIRYINMPETTIDQDSLPSVFQKTWKENPDPTALPFERDNPPFALTTVDWHQLSITDAEFTPHTWEDLHHLISIGELDELKRWPSQLKAYLAWTAYVKAKFGSATQYLLQQRLLWTPLSDTGVFKFELKSETPFEDPADYKIIMNDWTYAVTPGIKHIVVWSKKPLPVDREGALTTEGRKLVKEFVHREFRQKVGEEKEGEKVQWFKNTTNLQSVRSLEHVHVLVRGADEEVLKLWMK